MNHVKVIIHSKDIRNILMHVVCVHWGDLGLDGWTTLGWICRRWDVGIWTGLGWLRIETGGGRL